MAPDAESEHSDNLYVMTDDEITQILHDARLNTSNKKYCDFNREYDECTTDLERVKVDNAQIVMFLANLFTSPYPGEHAVFMQIKDEFKGWTVERFARLGKNNHQIRTQLKNTIQSYGLYIADGGESAAEMITALLSKTEPPMVWPDSELQTGKLIEGTLNYHRMVLTMKRLRAYDRKDDEAIQQQINKQINAETAATAAAAAITDLKLDGVNSLDPPLSNTQDPPNGTQSPPRPPTNPTPLPPSNHGAPLIDLDGDFTGDLTYEAYRKVPPPAVNNVILKPELVASFAKVWNKANSYTGKEYDVLDDKMLYFMDACRSLGIELAQMHAVFSQVLTDRALSYFITNIGAGRRIDEMYKMLKVHFDTEVNRAHYFHDWTSLTFEKVRTTKENQSKDPAEILSILLDKLQLCQRLLGVQKYDEEQLVATTVRAVRGIRTFKNALHRPQQTFEGFSGELRSAIEADRGDPEAAHFFTDHQEQPDQSTESKVLTDSTGEQYLVERRLLGKQRQLPRQTYSNPHPQFHGQRPFSSQSGGDRGQQRGPSSQRFARRQKTCIVCNDPHCWSTKHTRAEQEAAWQRFGDQQRLRGRPPTREAYAQFLIDWEGVEGETPAYEGDGDGGTGSDQTNAFIMDTFAPYDSFDGNGTSCGKSATAYLYDQAFLHQAQIVTDEEPEEPVPPDQFMLDRYSERTFQGILPDTGAAQLSTTGKAQFLALQED